MFFVLFFLFFNTASLFIHPGAHRDDYRDADCWLALKSLPLGFAVAAAEQIIQLAVRASALCYESISDIDSPHKGFYCDTDGQV